MAELLSAVRIEPNQARYSVIWLHGLGADGHDFEPIAEELNFKNKSLTRFIFPHAPSIPVTLNNGYVMPAWFDITGIGARYEQDDTGIRLTEQRIRAFIDNEIDSGIAPQKIILAGFSQGGAIALHTGLRYEKSLGGILALSTYLPLHELLPAERNEANAAVPVMMMHGLYDPVVPLDLAQMSKQFLSELGYPVSWQDYPMEHSVCPSQINDISLWFEQVLI